MYGDRLSSDGEDKVYEKNHRPRVFFYTNGIVIPCIHLLCSNMHLKMAEESTDIKTQKYIKRMGLCGESKYFMSCIFTFCEKVY
jgi:hypothetical protein